MSAASAVPTRYLEGKILVASPHARVRKQIRETLSPPAGQTVEAAGGADVLMKLEKSAFRTLLLDPALEDLDVDELVTIVRARYPELNVVVLERSEEPQQLSFSLIGELPDDTSGTPVSSVVEETVYKTTVPPAAAAFLEDRFEVFGEDSDQKTTAVDPLPGMIVCSPKMRQVCRLARLVAPRDTAVLIVGATGTGKELVARGIHALSRRSRGPFVVVNCAAIPESLLEAELFGFTRGAFTGAFQSRLGRIHAAHGGTLLLDEVGELPLSMQSKLLRFVQEGEVQRLGSADLFRVDARLIAATNADLQQRVREKQFREDLYYRLAVFPLELPPLRHRGAEILPLAQHFLEAFCHQAGVPRKVFTPEAAELLCRRSWPGNVRELQHAVERAFVLADAREQIRGDDLVVLSEVARD